MTHVIEWNVKRVKEKDLKADESGNSLLQINDLEREVNCTLGHVNDNKLLDIQYSRINREVNRSREVMNIVINIKK